MAYKTFYARSGGIGFTANTGKEITLYGGFYDYKVAQSFRKKKYLVLTTGDSTNGMLKKYPEYLYQTITEEDFVYIEKQLESVKQDPGYKRLEVCLEGKGTNNKLAYSSIGYTD